MAHFLCATLYNTYGYVLLISGANSTFAAKCDKDIGHLSAS